eukprot:TRINITY_DN13996_c0_g1_i1.p1 TRINITY_DN13996_c0_g1~~TRINITY_DN13996_c0_g1_i1.p1  ORF type:complete len:208 (-),score=20.21 TRINITY_DN13996_c0_g1_i1:46-669(-)
MITNIFKKIHSAQPSKINPGVLQHAHIEIAEGRNFESRGVNPYCKVRLGENVERTLVVQSSGDCIWNETYNFDITKKGQKLVIEVWNYVNNDKDQLLGMVSFQLDRVIVPFQGWIQTRNLKKKFAWDPLVKVEKKFPMAKPQIHLFVSVIRNEKPRLEMAIPVPVDNSSEQRQESYQPSPKRSLYRSLILPPQQPEQPPAPKRKCQQ